VDKRQLHDVAGRGDPDGERYAAELRIVAVAGNR
jgi:hypothetical protein